MKKKGFTLVELLAAILIIALLSTVGIIGFNTFFGNSNEKYYKTLESNLLLAGNDYFLDHRDELPTKGYTNSVEITALVEGKYIEPLKKTNGESCTKGKVYVYKEKDKYQYEACIECDENYTSNGEYCSGKGENEIVVSAKKAISNTTYNVSLDYDSVTYSNENIVVNISLKKSSINVMEYRIVNTKTKTKISCSKMENGICEAEINTSGTYEIIAILKDAEMLTKYFNVKIDKEKPKFTIVTDDIEPLTCVGTDTSRAVNIKIVKNDINEEYKSIEYKIYRKELNVTTGEQNRTLVKTGTEANLTRGSNGKEYYIKDSLGSGRYELEVSITNFTGEKITNNIPVEFDISYEANITYSGTGSKTTYGKHEVVYGQKYNYKEALPTSSNIESITLDSTGAKITGDTKVINTCTHGITANLKPPIKTDKLSVTYKKVNASGSKGIQADVKAASGRTGITITYFSDSKCKTKTTKDNAVKAGGAPKARGTYYIKASITASGNYTAASLGCTKAVTVCTLKRTATGYGGSCNVSESFGGCKKEGKNDSFCCNNETKCNKPHTLYIPVCSYACSD